MGGEAYGFIIRSRSVGFGSKIQVLEGLDGVVAVTPAAGRIVEALVGEEVFIGGVEGGAAGVVQAIGIDLDLGGIC